MSKIKEIQDIVSELDFKELVDTYFELEYNCSLIYFLENCISVYTKNDLQRFDCESIEESIEKWQDRFICIIFPSITDKDIYFWLE